MDNTNFSHAVKLMTQHNLQSENFREILQSRTNLDISIIEPDAVIDSENFDCASMLIVDFSSCAHREGLSDCLKNNPNIGATVLLNVSKDMDIEDVIRWRALRGVFSPKDSMSHVCDGLVAISNGENWLPRDMVNKLLSYYEVKVPEESEENGINVELTRREMEILESLKAGGSNVEIADSLFISEHTIKSHLYNIFKKLEVKNRIQAMAWARKNLT